MINPAAKSKGESSEDSKKKVMELMKPGKEKVKVKCVRKRKEGGQIIEAGNGRRLKKNYGKSGFERKWI